MNRENDSFQQGLLGPEFAEKIVSNKFFLMPSVLSAGSTTAPQRSISWQRWHSFALVAKATERLKQEYLIPQKSEIKHVNPILSETLDGKR